MDGTPSTPNVSKFLKLLRKYAYILFEVIQARNEPRKPRAELFVATVSTASRSPQIRRFHSLGILCADCANTDIHRVRPLAHRGKRTVCSMPELEVC
jgi:hypothetical protein